MGLSVTSTQRAPEKGIYRKVLQVFLPFALATTDQTCCWRRCHITADLHVCSILTGLLQLSVSQSIMNLHRTTTASTESCCQSDA